MESVFFIFLINCMVWSQIVIGHQATISCIKETCNIVAPGRPKKKQPTDYIPQVYLWFRIWQYHWPNKQTIKCTCITLYNCTLHGTIRTRAQSVRRQKRKRISQESEIVTYKHVTEVVRNRCVKHPTKRVDSRAILLPIATSVGALIIWIIKQTNTNIAYQTNKVNT